MAYVINAPMATANPVAKLTKLFAAFRASMAKQRVYYATLRELESLSKRELDDIGISSEQISEIARQGAFGK